MAKMPDFTAIFFMKFESTLFSTFLIFDVCYPISKTIWRPFPLSVRSCIKLINIWFLYDNFEHRIGDIHLKFNL